MAEQPALLMGAQVFSADGHHVGKIIELLTDEFIVAAGLLGGVILPSMSSVGMVRELLSVVLLS